MRGRAKLNKVWVIVACLIGDLTDSFTNTFRNSDTNSFSGNQLVGIIQFSIQTVLKYFLLAEQLLKFFFQITFLLRIPIFRQNIFYFVQ